MRENSDVIMKWSVKFTKVFYEFVVRNFYFFLSNIIFFLFLLVFEITINNLLIYTIPIFLYINSYSVQFELIKNQSQGSNLYDWESYIKTFKKSIKSYWKVYLVMTVLVQILLINLWIVTKVPELNFMIIPLLITGVFMVNSFYYFLEDYLYKSSSISVNSVSSSLILSYGNLSAFFKNTLLLMIKIVLGLLVTPVIVLIFGDLISRMVVSNMKTNKLYNRLIKK